MANTQVRSQQTRTLRAQSTPAAIPAPSLASQGYGAALDLEERPFDLFLSHASEDKGFVAPLAEALRRLGVRVWYDDSVLTVGDSLRESIDRGLSKCRFGVVVFSRRFFAKNWPAYELNGLVAREMAGKKVILPVWHPDLTHDELVDLSPSMADKVALVGASLPMDDIAGRLAELVLGDS